MSNSPPDWLNDYPSGVREALEAALTGRLDPPIVLTGLFLLLGKAAEISSLLARAESDAHAAGDDDGARRIDAVRDRMSHDPAAFEKMRAVLAILHGQSARQPSADPFSVAASFDAAAELSPAASVALYSLGDATLLGGATQELVSLLRARGLISRKSRVFEIGCGIGRFAEALAAEIQSFQGIDVSQNMIRIARERCTDFANVAFSLTSGEDLGQYADASFDLVLAVDSFPYIVATRRGLAELHITESARVLAPGGNLAIFNFAYEEEFDVSRERLGRVACEAGLALVAAESNPLRSWDGSFFQLRKQSRITQFDLV
jgi:predicted TPR repeat methyltransferase